MKNQRTLNLHDHERRRRTPFFSAPWLLLVLFWMPDLLATDCSQADISLYTQQEVDDFQATYGGGGICDRVTQNLHVASSSNISNLDGLANLTSVGAVLSIGSNHALTSLTGLSSLTSVGGTVEIYRNDTLTNFVGLSSLTSVGGDLNIVYNPALTSLDGLSSLTNVAGVLQIEGNRVLTNLDGLSGLASVDGGVMIYNNSGLTGLDGLSNLTSAAGGFFISDNGALTSLNGLSGFTSLAGGIYIHRNALTDLDGLSGLTSLGGLAIVYEAALTDLDGLSNLTSLGGLTMKGNAALTDLTGLSGLTSLNGNLTIEGNDALTDLAGLTNLASLGGNLTVEDNAALTNFDGLSGLASLGGSLQIRNSAVLTDLTGLSGLTSVGGALYISRTAALTSLDGLSGFSSLGAGLYINDNAALANLDGLSGLGGLGGSMSVIDNAVLTDLDGLSNLTSIGGNETNVSLNIVNNTALTNLDGLSGLASMIEVLTITDNDALTNLDGLSSLIGVSDFVYVENNAALTNLDGLSGLTSVVRVSIDSNAALTNVDGLSSLTSVGSRGFFIQNNTVLTDLDGLSSLASVAGELHIKNNASLANLDGLSSLASVYWSLVIFENVSLANLDGLSSLTSVDALTIGSNAALTNLDGLSSLASVKSSIYIQGNPMLTNVNGLSDFANVGTHLYLRENSLLGNCTGLVKLLDQVDDDEPGPGPGESGIPDVGGKVSVELNLDGCNSVEEILPAPDQDGDGIPDVVDNCPAVANADQADLDGDGIGDACDPQNDTDSDADGTRDEIDNCPNTPNANQKDTDGDGIGDVCDPQDDTDTDQDGIRDEIDNCPAVANPDQADANNNGTGDACEQATVSAQQSQVVKAFEVPLESDSRCRGIGEINGELLALIDVQEFGCELWRIDELLGHSLFADINPGEADSEIFAFGSYFPFEGWYYFGAYDDSNGSRLWRTDGLIAEQVIEAEPGDGAFSSIPINRAEFDGRYYFTARRWGGKANLYSAEGSIMRPEPQPPLESNGHVDGLYTLVDKLIVTVEDDAHGTEPWVYDGDEYRILADLVPGPESSLLAGDRWFYFDESRVFNARVLNESNEYESAYFFTDGETVTRIPHSGPWHELTARGGFVNTHGALYAIDSYASTGIPVMRISKTASAAYEIHTGQAKTNLATTSAILNDEALVLYNNHMFSLGAAATEVPFDPPTDWTGSTFEFVGSGAYFSHAYIKETGQDGDSRVWAWNFTEASLLMAGESNVVTHAEYFRHIGNDIYFYGKDQMVGMALRKIPNAVIKPVPLLGAVTGSWYDPATSGQGFVLHPVDDQYTVISFYGFENDGKPLWLTGVAQEQLLPGYPNEIAMNITSGGNFGSFTPGQISEELWGTLRLTFDNCSKATAEFAGLSGQQTMHMVRLAGLEGIDCYYSTPPAAQAAGITGSWYDPATSGQGFVLHPMNDGQMIVSFYGYKNNSERLWLIGSYGGQVTAGRPLVVNMITASGGRFGGFAPGDITESPWGTLTIDFADCDKATATLDGVDGQQTMNLIKLAGLQGSGLNCH